jgi:hypothetical protein
MTASFCCSVAVSSAPTIGYLGSSCKPLPNPAVDLAPFGRWTLRDKAAQRRSPLRWASPPMRVCDSLSYSLRNQTRICAPSHQRRLSVLPHRFIEGSAPPPVKLCKAPAGCQARRKTICLGSAPASGARLGAGE